MVEVSAGVGEGRADLLARLVDGPVRAGVAGERVLPEARHLAHLRGVFWMRDGRAFTPEGNPLR